MLSFNNTHGLEAETCQGTKTATLRVYLWALLMSASLSISDLSLIHMSPHNPSFYLPLICCLMTFQVS